MGGNPSPDSALLAIEDLGPDIITNFVAHLQTTVEKEAINRYKGKGGFTVAVGFWMEQSELLVAAKCLQ